MEVLAGILSELSGKSAPEGATQGPRTTDPSKPNRGAGVDPDNTGQSAATVREKTSDFVPFVMANLVCGGGLPTADFPTIGPQKQWAPEPGLGPDRPRLRSEEARRPSRTHLAVDLAG